MIDQSKCSLPHLFSCLPVLRDHHNVSTRIVYASVLRIGLLFWKPDCRTHSYFHDPLTPLSTRKRQYLHTYVSLRASLLGTYESDDCELFVGAIPSKTFMIDHGARTTSLFLRYCFFAGYFGWICWIDERHHEGDEPSETPNLQRLMTDAAPQGV